MCTVTWLAESGGYSLLFNRDEKHTRGIAERPRKHSRDGVRFASPIDSDGGGTWIAANEHGLTVCLLNAYSRASRWGGTPTKSRGIIPFSVASSRALEEIAERINRTPVGCFAPFRLLALEPDRAAWLFEWSGSEITIDRDANARMPLTSSSFESSSVAASRHTLFQQHIATQSVVTRASLERFHAGHDPAPNAYSVCMHRTDARTVSFSRVTVGASDVRLDYSSDAPCRARPPTTVCLQRRSGRPRHPV